MKLRKVITTAGFMFAGVSSANAQLYMCQSCPVGSWSDGTMASCKNCLTTGVTACNSITGKATSCKPGYKLSNGTCSACSSGYYSAGGIATSCTICPAGTYSAGGTASCTKCSAGYYSSTGASSCTKCSAGYYSSTGASSCTKCSAGYYSSTGATSCSECSSGTYSSAGASSCTKCSTGYFSEKAWDSCSNKWIMFYSNSRYNTSMTLSAGMYKFYVKGGQGYTEYEGSYKYCGLPGDTEVVYRYFSSDTQIKMYVYSMGASSEIYLSNGELIARASAGEDGGGSKIYVHETSSTATDSCPESSGKVVIYKLFR